jgi:rhodanese-related sulfurtransferase
MPTEIDRHEVQRLVEQGAQIVDVMPTGEYELSHLRGAVNVPLSHLPEKAQAELERGRPVITYCYDSL